VDRKKSVIENIISYAATLLNRFRFVEPPMNAEINSALTILLFSL
jgi:hypothetical protein